MSNHRSQFTLFVLVAVVLAAALFMAGCTQTPSGGTTTQVPTTLPPTTQAPVVNQTTNVTTAPTAQIVPGSGTLKIATTTSLYDTKLLDAVQDFYKKKYGVDLKITSQGTGKAIELAKKGDVDLLLVHSPSQESAFIEDGYGLNPRCFAYNYFLIVGPESDPAGIKGMKPEAAFAKIMELGKKGDAKVMFASRGDNSGTHTAEKSIWSLAKKNYTTEVQKSGKWYIETGKSMGETLQLANEKGAYTLTDEGTFLAFKSKLGLVPLVTEGDALLNRYSAIAINPGKVKGVNLAEANRFITWIVSDEGKQFVGNYGKDTYGKSLFTPLGADQCGKAPFNCDCMNPAIAERPVIVYHAGSLASAFKQMVPVFDKANPTYDLQLFSSASQVAVDKVTKNGKQADVVASADNFLIPQYMMPKYADSYVNFAKNRMVIGFTNNSTGASSITKDNWYDVLMQDGVTFMGSNPNTDPGGYRVPIMIQLAERFYGKDFLFDKLIREHSSITRDFNNGKYIIDVRNPKTDGKKYIIYETADEAANLMKTGKVDYRIGYENVMKDAGLQYITLPEEIDLSNQNMEKIYSTVQVKRASGTDTGSAILYGATVPTNAMNKDGGQKFVVMLLSPDGQAILEKSGLIKNTPATGGGNISDAFKPFMAKA